MSLLAVEHDVGEDGLEVTERELLLGVAGRLGGQRLIFQELALDGGDIAHHVGLAQVPREKVVHLLDDFRKPALLVRITLAGAGFAHRLKRRGFSAFEVELLLLEALQTVVRQPHVGVNLQSGAFVMHSQPRHQVFAKDVVLLEVRVVVGDDLREEIIHPEKCAQILAELVGLFFRQLLEAVGGGLQVGMKAGLLAFGIEEGLGEGLDFGGQIDGGLVELGLQLVDDVGVGDLLEAGGAIIGQKALQNLLGLVGEVEDEGVFLARIGAVQPLEGLHGKHPGEPLVHVHGLQEGLVESGLVFVRHN